MIRSGALAPSEWVGRMLIQMIPTLRFASAKRSTTDPRTARAHGASSRRIRYDLVLWVPLVACPPVRSKQADDSGHRRPGEAFDLDTRPGGIGVHAGAGMRRSRHWWQATSGTQRESAPSIHYAPESASRTQPRGQKVSRGLGVGLVDGFRDRVDVTRGDREGDRP